MSIIYDGWTDCGVHYGGMLTVYNRRRQIVENYRQSFLYEVVAPLLSMSPMSKVCTCDFADFSRSNTAKQFDASTHSTHILQVLELFNVEFKTWVVSNCCQLLTQCSNC